LHTPRHAPPVVGERHGGVTPEWQPRFSGKQGRQARITARQRNAPHDQVRRARLILLPYRHPSMCSSKPAAASLRSPC
jgi:hypothetical protein